MYDSLAKPWSDNPYAPPLSYSGYVTEKNYLAGALIGAIFYGIVVVLFFRCMCALLHPTHCAREGVRWALVAYTATMFTFVTITVTMSLYILFICYVDNRGFPSTDVLPSGPYGYLGLNHSKAIFVVPNLMFLLNNWLADGVLLYRCCVIYATNYWVTAFPCLMYLASLATGIMLIYYQTSEPTTRDRGSVATSFNYPYFAISLGLNILLTSMIVMRLVLRSRYIRNAMGAPAITSGLYRAILTLLIESSALYAVSFLLFIVPWAAGSSVSGIFSPILADVQVIAPFFIILRIADRSAVTSDITVSGSSASNQSRSQGESASSNEIPPDEDASGCVDALGKSPRKLSVEVEPVVDVHQDPFSNGP